MSIRTKFRSLKKINLHNSYISLAIIKEYKRNRISHYVLKYVQIDERLENRLRNIVLRKIDNANSFEKYSLDCPEPEEEQVRVIKFEETDFLQIMEKLNELNPEEDIIESVDELVKAKSYLIILRDDNGIKVVGFKTIPENWKMKKDKGLIPLLFRENRFEDLENETVFSVSSTLDFIYYDEMLFILSKKLFENGLNFRKGMIAKAEEFYKEVKEAKLFVNLDLLTNRVSNNQRYLRKIATIKNLGYYHDKNFLHKFKEISDFKNWGINFQNGKIVIAEETLDPILTILQNKRLHSELSEEDFDVESAKRLEI